MTQLARDLIHLQIPRIKTTNPQAENIVALSHQLLINRQLGKDLLDLKKENERLRSWIDNLLQEAANRGKNCADSK